ncbi:MAG: c-type cytochrome [Planctomycetes bacterium]|nr:c-type cytochrome [Planctomycetota bacterium]
MISKKRFLPLLCLFLFQLSLLAAPEDYYSPLSLTPSKDGKILFIEEVTKKMIVTLDLKSQKVTKKYKLPAEPHGITLSRDGRTLYAACGYAKGELHIIDAKNLKVKKVIEVGHSPIAPVESLDGKKIYLCNRFLNSVCTVDLKSKKVTSRVPVTREPIAMVLTLDGKFLYVANHLPAGAANVDHMTSVIDIIDTKTNKICKSIALPNGAIDLRGMCLSHDGKFVYVPSILARFLVPTTQIERGWINTHAMNIINVKEQANSYTVLLDDVDMGAANPWGITCTDDGKYICVAHSATNEMSLIDRDALHKKLSTRPKNQAGGDNMDEKEMYETQADNPVNDLSFLTGIRSRVHLPGIGPRGVAAINNTIYLSQYFSDDLATVKINKLKEYQVGRIPLGPTKEMDSVRKGEMFFNDASLCFQQWQACSTCHPDVRTDAVNWDLLNDGIGNPKSTKSLLYAHFTPPAMISGIRANANIAVRAGIQYIQFSVVDEVKASAIDDFLMSLKHIPSPHLVNGELSKQAKRGKVVYDKAKCNLCHSGEYYTNNGMYNVGTGDLMEKDRKFNVPTLVELWRTAPYLYDGRAETLEDAFTTYNKNDQHGKTSKLTQSELDDLIKYIQSL